jgi:hypothetical protein
VAFSTPDGRDAVFADQNLPYQPATFASNSSVWDNPNCVMLMVDQSVQNYTLAIKSCDNWGAVVCTVGSPRSPGPLSEKNCASDPLYLPW